MSPLPRLAVGSIHAEAPAQFVVWGLLRLMQQHGVQVQHFYAHSAFSPLDGARVATGLRSRHLDSWLMSPEVCRRLLALCSGKCDLALVEGTFQPQRAGHLVPCGHLDELSHWLQLPRVGVVDVRHLDRCRTEPPGNVDAVLLCGLESPRQMAYWQTVLEPLWGCPVLGGMQASDSLFGQLAALPLGSKPAAEHCNLLAQAVARFTRVDRVFRFAQTAPAIAAREDRWPQGPRAQAVRIAVACDAAFDCYFPDTLDLLERLGAELVPFSPLRDEQLPPGVDVVYLGCGHPERYARRLSRNCCMIAALRMFVAAGGKLYAEGGGLAYLCQHLEDLRGRRWNGAGVFRLLARPRREILPPQPTQLCVECGTWLTPPQTVLRGYRNGYWELLPLAPDGRVLDSHGRDISLVCVHQAVGSTLHLNFAAQGEVLQNFFAPPDEPLYAI